MSFTDIRKFPWVKQIPSFYHDIIVSYNKSKVIQYDDFCQNITNQPLFGNKFLTLKKTTLFFKSWIQEGFTAFKNLKIVNGKLDVNYLNEILIDKRQLHSQVNMLQKSFILAKLQHP